MQIIYKEVEGGEKPLEIDVDSSKYGVYIRRNIKQVTKNIEGAEEPIKVWEYQEAYLSKSEFEQYSNDLLVGEINGEDNTKEYEEYKNKLNTPVEYTNGHFYKPKWISIYSSIIDEFAIKAGLYEKLGGNLTPIIDIKTPVYDVTGKAENAELMSVAEVIELWLFLYQKKEQYFAEYKQAVIDDKEG